MDLARHRDAVLAFVGRLVVDRAVADDLTQETLLRAELKQSSFRADAAERTWLLAIALNACRDHFRREQRRAQRCVDVDPAERIPADVDLADALAQAAMSQCIGRYVLQLPERQRQVVALHDVGGLDHKEIGRLLGISEANSRVVLHRGRAALRELLEANCVLAFGDDVPCAPRSRG